MSTILWSFGIWSTLERWKRSMSRCLKSWPKRTKKNLYIFIYFIFYATTTNHFSICDIRGKVDRIRQPAMTSSVGGLRRRSKALPKAKLALKKGGGHCLVVCCPSDPLQLSESQWNHYIWGVCSASWRGAVKTAMPAVGTGQQKGHNSSPRQRLTARHTNNTSKSEWLRLSRFASSTIFTWPPANRLPLLLASQQLFAGKMLHNQQEAENAFQESDESWGMDFYHTAIGKLISRWQKCVDCNGPYFD